MHSTTGERKAIIRPEAIMRTQAEKAAAFLPDGTHAVSRAEVLDNGRIIAAATDLPVNADLENGYADEPRAAAEMIKLAAEAGIVGGSIEDATGDPTRPIYDFNQAVERVQAAVEVARALPLPTCSMRRVCATSLPSAPWRRRSAGRSTWS
jgi:2-methylisocitrate lyase-like PEP mutase family enzyme